MFSEDTVSSDHKLRVFHLVTIVWRLSLRTCDSLGYLRGDTLLTFGPSRNSTQLRRVVTQQAQKANQLEKRKMKREMPVPPHDDDLTESPSLPIHFLSSNTNPGQRDSAALPPALPPSCMAPLFSPVAVCISQAPWNCLCSGVGANLQV